MEKVFPLQVEATCEHPKLASWTDSMTAERCHQCMSCGEQIIVPLGTSFANEDGMICLAFGERWRGRAYQGTRIVSPRVFRYPVM